MGFFKNLYTVFDFIADPSEYRNTGASGERFTYRELKEYFFPKQILRNLYLKKKNGKLTETDLLLVTQKGIFVVESKNYSGWIFGNEKNRDWTQTFPNGSKFKFFNPIIQNNLHIESLRHNLSDFPNMTYFSIIVFSERCKLKNISVFSNNIYVIQRQNLISTIKNILSLHPEIINNSDMDKIIKHLSSASRPCDEIKKQHLNELQ